MKKFMMFIYQTLPIDDDEDGVVTIKKRNSIK